MPSAPSARAGAARWANQWKLYAPPIASLERTNGWRDLVRHEAGGGAPSKYVRHTFDGTRYVEQGRSSGDTIPAGTVMLSGDITFEKGVPLEPKR